MLDKELEKEWKDTIDSLYLAKDTQAPRTFIPKFTRNPPNNRRNPSSITSQNLNPNRNPDPGNNAQTDPHPNVNNKNKNPIGILLELWSGRPLSQ